MAHIKRKPHRIRTKKSAFKKPAFWTFILVLLIIGAFFYFLLFFDKFQVKNIVISGNQKVRIEDIKAIVMENITKNMLVFKSQSIFLASLSDLNSQIRDKFPEISSASTKRKLFDTLVVNIQERNPALVFCSLFEGKDSCCLLDNTGVAFENVEDRNRGLPIVRQDGLSKTALGQEVLAQGLAGYIVEAQKSLNEKFGIDIKSAEIISDARMDALTSEGWEIHFNLAADMGLQITKLSLLLEKEISAESRGTLQYVDLRFQDRAYYK